jgi:hypothetical protein
MVSIILFLFSWLPLFLLLLSIYGTWGITAGSSLFDATVRSTESVVSTLSVQTTPAG